MSELVTCERCGRAAEHEDLESCSDCNGTGKGLACWDCDGSGEHECSCGHGHTCHGCYGVGRILLNQNCPACWGTGRSTCCRFCAREDPTPELPLVELAEAAV